MLTGHLDSAYNYLQQSLRLCKSYSVKAAATKALAQYYAKVEHPTLAMKYALQSSAYNDSDLVEVRKLSCSKFKPCMIMEETKRLQK